MTDRDAPELIASSGVGPFVTRRVWRHQGRPAPMVWQSREHRKRLRNARRAASARFGAILRPALWMPDELNWWIAVGFALGSLCFLVASLLSLAPALAGTAGLNSGGLNTTYFIGSIFFTAAAFLQVDQAANAGAALPEAPQPRRRLVVIGWMPRDIGWLSCALQFVGTLLFNVSTFDATLGGLGWLGQDLAIWVPDVLGSVLFLASGYLALIETCHGLWAWKPRSLPWRIAAVNFAGCLAFMVSAVLAFVPEVPVPGVVLTLSTAGTLVGALGFLTGAILSLPEGISTPSDASSPT